jgi:CBS domain-containing protein
MEPIVVHQHRVLGADGREQSSLFVRCPEGDRVKPLAACEACARSRGVVHDPRLDRDVVDCDQAPIDETTVVPAHARARDGDPLRGATVAQAMSQDLLCAVPEAPLGAVRREIEADAVGAIVVVDRERVVGIVSVLDLLRGVASGARTAREVMTARPLAVSDTMALSRAAAIMAYEGVHHLVVTDEAGALVGLLSTIDVLRHLGQRAGAVIPHATSRQRREPA